jgi:hypothetical protein
MYFSRQAASYTAGYELVMYCRAVAALLSALPVILCTQSWRESASKRDAD